MRAQQQPDGARLFPPNILAELEQYRYVAFDPTVDGKLDWSHEREWRWPNRRHAPFSSYYTADEGTPEHDAWISWSAARMADRFGDDGLCLDTGSFDNIGFVVKNQRQARLLTHDILRLVDTEAVSMTTFGFILRLDALTTREKLVDPAETERAIKAATVPLKQFYSIDAISAKKMRDRFSKVVRSVCNDPRDDEGESGGCWLWLMDNADQLTRALLLAPEEEQRLVISQLGRYLVRLPELGDGRGLRLREELTREIAHRIHTEFGSRATYYSVLGSDDPDGVPSYTDDFDDIYENEAHNKDDF